MEFKIEPEVFAKLPTMYVGVVVAQGIDNTQPYPEITAMLNQYTAQSKQLFADANVKQRPEIIPYREAFRQIGINPNRYPCSAEALFKRLSKGKDLPTINPLVDLNNAISLKYTLPMGTHTLDGVREAVEMRFAQPGDEFVPLGTDQVETLDAGEVVYAVGQQVRTRRWTWRQSEHGKITPATTTVFFPIDGFVDVNRDTVDAAAKDLEKQLQTLFHCTTVRGAVDREHPAFQWTFD
ncbi:MAG TPA: hypothetical protein K8U88_06630 [Levilactobacillus hammesii]|uniref:B3/B4 tRNA-binding domain-containing protein n=1 Tax=Levilactobacillus hammesii TaxID=267633 RepID=A0A921EZY3_9LACO|nr:hypothetical protein [Levilactobacillus hammesii]